MKVVRFIPAWILVLMIGASALAADTHVVFKSKRNIFGREKILQWESWAGDGKRYRKGPLGTSIVRGDMGLRWNLNPASKTYSEMPLAPNTPAVKETFQPDRKNEKEDLRFAGMDYKQEFEWKIADAEATETRHGLECRRHRLIGDAEFSHIELIVWVSSLGKDKGLDFVPEILGVFRRNFDADAVIARLLERSPEGGIVDLQAVLESSFGSDMTFSVEIESLEESAPPAGIYEIPADFKKGA